MEVRADRVAQVIQAPSIKDSAADVMFRARALNDSDKIQTEEKRRTELARQHSQENYARSLQLKANMRSSSEYRPPASPNKRPPSPESPELSNAEQAQIWRKIEQNLLKYKKETQQTYKQLLDEQLQQKEMLARLGNMTQIEKSMNKGELRDFKERQGNLNAMVPGMFNESPLRAGPLKREKSQRDHARYFSMRTSIAHDGD